MGEGFLPESVAVDYFEQVCLFLFEVVVSCSDPQVVLFGVLSEVFDFLQDKIPFDQVETFAQLFSCNSGWLLPEGPVLFE